MDFLFSRFAQPVRKTAGDSSSFIAANDKKGSDKPQAACWLILLWMRRSCHGVATRRWLRTHLEEFMSRRKLGRRTKIICTLGPATNNPEKIRALVQAGMDVARLNF